MFCIYGFVNNISILCNLVKKYFSVLPKKPPGVVNHQVNAPKIQI